MHEKWKDAGFIAYFQSFTNTYGKNEDITCFLQQALNLPVEEIRIATRGDCIDEEKADILLHFSKIKPLVVELGLQTIFDETAKEMNRCHTFEDFLKGYNLLQKRNIPCAIHIINGLPHENAQMMIETAKTVSLLKPLSMKIHMLHIIKGSILAEIYQQTPFPLLSKQEYVDIVCRQLEVIDENIVIERLTGDGAADSLIAPLWTKKKLTVINDIDKLLLQRDSWQGKLL